MCSAFLWSGPDLKTTKAKVSWKEICLPKNEGGLGLRPLKETNKVLCLKLIWRIYSSRSSLWVKWIHCYLIRKGLFWSVKGSTVSGSWMWRKLLNLRELAQQYLRMEVRNGERTTFWYDHWSRFGCLKEVLGEGRRIDLGIVDNATVAEVLVSHRRRRHRADILNEVEVEIASLRQNLLLEEDIPLWKQADGKYASKFITKKRGNSCGFLIKLAPGVRECGSLKRRQSTLFCFGQLCGKDCKQGTGCSSGTLLQIQLVYCAMQPKNHAAISSLVVDTQVRFGRLSLEGLCRMFSQQIGTN